jgi:predicted PurR-regulated permease PerM
MEESGPKNEPEVQPQASATPVRPGEAHPEEIAPFPSAEKKTGFPTTFARLFFGFITLLVLYYSYLIVKPYLTDIFLALVLFFVAKPLYQALLRLLRGKKIIASLLTVMILAIVILAPLAGLLSIIANQAIEFSNQASKGLQGGQVWDWFADMIDFGKDYLARLNLPLPPEDIDLEQIIRSLLTKISAFVYNNAVNLVKGFTFFFLDLVLVLFIAFFMFIQGDNFIEEIRKLSPLDPAHNEEILRETESTIKVTLWGTVIVGFVQGILGGVGFWLCGVPQPAFWGTVMVPASVVPIVGSTIIWLPAALYLLFKGNIIAGLGLIFWGSVIVSLVDNILRPIIVKGHGSTPTILVLFSILGGLEYFGILGFILGPLILSFLLSLLRIYQKTFLAQPTPTPIPPPPDVQSRPPRSSPKSAL